MIDGAYLKGKIGIKMLQYMKMLENLLKHDY
jgi:hypothetical protein